MKLVGIVFFASIILTIDGSPWCCSRVGVGYVKKYGSSFLSELWATPVAKHYQSEIFGHYKKTDEAIHNRPVYRSEKHEGNDAIWFCGEQWYIGRYEDREFCEGYAHAGWDNAQDCVERIQTFDWRVWATSKELVNGGEWRDDKHLAVRCA